MSRHEINPVGFLQDISSKYKLPHMPTYTEQGADGPAHRLNFSVKCQFDSYEVVGSKTSKKLAKADAASIMIATLRNDGYFERYNVQVNWTTGETSLIDQADETQPVAGNLSKHPVTYLQEYSQKKSVGMPAYEDLSCAFGTFATMCKLMGHETTGQGKTKKESKTFAALEMCRLLRLVAPSEDCDMVSGSADGSLEFASSPKENYKSPISRLKEHCEGCHPFNNPVYKTSQIAANMFVVECIVGDRLTKGEGSSIRAAKTMAADNMLQELEIDSIELRAAPIQSINEQLEEFLTEEEEAELSRSAASLEREPNVIMSLHCLGLNDTNESNSSRSMNAIKTEPEGVDTVENSLAHLTITDKAESETEDVYDPAVNELGCPTSEVKTEAIGEEGAGRS